MDLSTVDPALIEARGLYATVNGKYKDTMEEMQQTTQKACDYLRAVLQDDVNRHHHIAHVEMLVGMLATIVESADELRKQKDELYPAAWGKNVG
jgi:CHASE3 domain sensor protein